METKTLSVEAVPQANPSQAAPIGFANHVQVVLNGNEPFLSFMLRRDHEAVIDENVVRSELQPLATFIITPAVAERLVDALNANLAVAATDGQIS